MQKKHYSIVINAPRETVYKTMLNDATYREWTSAFAPGGYFEGDWSEGSEMRFVGSDPEHPEETALSGMITRVAKNTPNEFVSLEAVGQILNGVDDTTSDSVQQWLGAKEEYTFKEVDGGTELSVDQDTPDEFVEGFSAMWPKGLEKLKEICERS
jgi:uncharacterized protein YndB with AHSA1/START domain